jgi:hypothetical protein
MHAMKIFRSRSAITLATAAMLSMVASPAMARGWHGHRHHRGGVDAGDVFAGLLIIGGIAAIASAANKSNREKRDRDYRDRYPEPNNRDYPQDRDYGQPSGRYDDRAPGGSYSGSARSGGSMVGAVDICVSHVERGDRQVETVDSVSREPDGWRVDGRIAGDGDFSCIVDRDGQVTRATVDGRHIS